ncbi:MAG: hypothetical protein KDA84_04815, partial [Planctomycetaceae bacterium]|nr:hypothetical protein [Planctomycetaceae bacterium]
RWLVTACDDGAFRVWDLLWLRVDGAPMWHAGTVTGVEFSPEGDRLLTRSADKIVRLWSLATGEPEVTEFGGTMNASQLYPEKSGEFALFRYGDGLQDGVQFWKNGQPSSGLLAGIDREFIVHPQRIELASEVQLPGNRSGVRVADIASGKTSLIYASQDDSGIRGVFYTPAGELGVIDGEDRSKVVKDPYSNQVIYELPASSSQVWPSPSGKWLLVLGYEPDGERRIHIVDAISGEARASTGTIKLGAGTVLVEFDDRENFAVIRSPDIDIHVWDLENNRPRFPKIPHDRRVVSLAISPVGNRFAVGVSSSVNGWGSDPGTITLRDTSTGQPTAPTIRFFAPPRRLIFSPDSQTIVAGSTNGGLKVWDANTGHSLSSLIRPGKTVYGVAFTDENRKLVAATSGGIVRYRINAESRTPQDWEQIAQVLSSRRLDERGHVRPFSLDQETWKEFQSSHPEVFSVTESARRRWQLHEAANRYAEKWSTAAIGHLDWAIEETPDSWPLHFRRGMANMQGKHWDQAILDFQKAVQLGGQDEATIWFSLASCQTEKKDWQGVVDSLTNIIGPRASWKS